MGAFIVFEGGDGSGKSTQARILKRRLSRKGYPVVLTHEPGGTPLGEAARRWLKGRPGLTPLTELFLFSAARAQTMDRVVSPSLDSHQTVICDRFCASTVVYQGHGRGLDLELIERINGAATGGIRPDLTVLLDIPAEIGLARRSGAKGDPFESEALEFHRRVRQGYLALASGEPRHWLVLDGTQEKHALAAQILAKVEPLL